MAQTQCPLLVDCPQENLMVKEGECCPTCNATQSLSMSSSWCSFTSLRLCFPTQPNHPPPGLYLSWTKVQASVIYHWSHNLPTASMPITNSITISFTYHFFPFAHWNSCSYLKSSEIASLVDLIQQDMRTIANRVRSSPSLFICLIIFDRSSV